MSAEIIDVDVPRLDDPLGDGLLSDSARAVSREMLYAQVWAEPMTKVAARYNVSSNYLARICERLKIPRPSRGYWARLAVGRTLAPPSLPEAKPGDELEWTRDGSHPKTVPWPPPKAPTVEEWAAMKPRRLSVEHPLVRTAREYFQDLRESRSQYLKPKKSLVADIFVSRETLERALKFASKVFRAFESRGIGVALGASGQWLGRPDLKYQDGKRGPNFGYEDRWSPGRPTVASVGTVAIGMTIYEIAEEVEFKYVDGDYVRIDQLSWDARLLKSGWTSKRDAPNGRLAIRLYSPYAQVDWEKDWREARGARLSRQIPEMVQAAVDAAPVIASRVEERDRKAEEERRRWMAEAEERKRQLAEQQRRKAAEDSREQLLGIINAWSLAQQVERFFVQAAREAATLGNAEAPVMHERLRSAREMFGGTDALPHFKEWRTAEERLPEVYKRMGWPGVPS